MEVELLAFDSMGVRSMCTRIATDDLALVIDPGLALGPKRFGLPPHRLEQERLAELAGIIAEEAKDADLIAISHYHSDHCDPGDLIPMEIYSGKKVLLKNPDANREGGLADFKVPLFIGMVRERAESVEMADGKKFRFGGTTVEFSKALCHGASSTMGHVLEVMVSDGNDTVVHTSDIQGFVQGDQADFAIERRPRLVIADGPMTYMLGQGFSQENLEASIGNIRRVLGCGIVDLVLDHHFLRDLNFRQYLDRLTGEFPQIRIMTAAEYMGRENDPLEARRRELYSLCK